MSGERQFLIADSLEHALALDQFICEYFRDDDGNKGSQWSGVFAKPGLLSDTYAVIWDEKQLRDVFGDDPALTIETEEIDKEGESNWQDLPEPEQEGKS